MRERDDHKNDITFRAKRHRVLVRYENETPRKVFFPRRRESAPAARDLPEVEEWERVREDMMKNDDENFD